MEGNPICVDAKQRRLKGGNMAPGGDKVVGRPPYSPREKDDVMDFKPVCK